MADRPRRRRGAGRWGALSAWASRTVLPRTADFRVLLGEQAEVVVEALTALADYAASGDPELAERVATLEKAGDRLRERNLSLLRRAFATSFDRDLTAVAIRRIDDVANYAKTTVREMGLLSMEPDDTVRDIAALLRDGAVELRAAVYALGGDPREVEERVARVHKAERRVEKIYRAAVVDLFGADTHERWRAEGDPIVALLSALRAREVYRHMSNAADRLEAAGRVVLDIAVATT